MATGAIAVAGTGCSAIEMNGDGGDGDPDNAETMLAAVGAIAAFAGSFPLVSPIGLLLRGIVESALQANYNKTAARLLALRSRDVALALADVLPVAQGASASLDSELARLKKLLGEATDFMNKFKKRSYLSRMLKGGSDARSLENMDKQITDTIQSMQLSLGAAQMKMQQRSFEEVAKVSELLAAKGGADGIKDDPEALAAVAGAARVPVDELRGELDTFFKELQESQARIESKLDQVLAGQQADAPSSDKLASFWDEYFDTKIVPFAEFLPVFEEEFNGGEELTKEQRIAFEECVDAYPHDGKVSIVEWKKFQKKWVETGLGTVAFIDSIIANTSGVPGS